MKKIFWVYILECANGSYYTGFTVDLKKRFAAHVAGSAKCKYTRSFKPVRIAQTWQIQDDKSQALRLEVKIKRLSKAQKQKLIKNPQQLLEIHFPC